MSTDIGGEANEKDTQVPRDHSPSSTLRDEEYGPIYNTTTPPADLISKTSTKTVEGGVLARTLSRFRTKDSLDPIAPPPDGGITAWSQALLCHLVLFNTWGFINSFGLFQTYYTASLSQPPSTISWIGSVQIFTPFLIGALSGRATDAGFFRLTFTVGMVVQLLGLFMTSLCTKYWQVFLAQGICVGLGNGLVFIPSLTICSTYFLKNRGLALGIAASGSATGGLVYPAIAESLLPRVGFGWTVRVMGLVMAVTMVLCAAFLKPRLPPRRAGPLVEWAAFKELPYALFAVGSFLMFWGLYVVFYYVGSFSRDTLHTSQSTSISLLLTINGVGLPGRLVPNYLADRLTGPLNLITIFAGTCSVIMYCWIAVHTVTGVWAFAVIYGSCAAGVQSLFPATVASLTTDPKRAGVRMGMVFSVVGFATLNGPPLAGALIQKGNGSYLCAQIFAATAMGAGCAMVGAARWAKVGWRVKAKV